MPTGPEEAPNEADPDRGSGRPWARHAAAVGAIAAVLAYAGAAESRDRLDQD